MFSKKKSNNSGVAVVLVTPILNNSENYLDIVIAHRMSLHQQKAIGKGKKDYKM